MKTLPYRAVTSSGAVTEVRFDLHPETVSPERVGELVTGVLAAIDGQIEGREPAANGDVLQALAMALALRASMLPARRAMQEHLLRDVVDRAWQSLADATRFQGGGGHG
jgi:hypothetical protein